jgi:hypothetical protein
MAQALLHTLEPGRICQVVPDGQQFDVHANFSWVSVPDDTTTADRYINGEVVKYNVLDDSTFQQHGYKVARGIKYGSLGDQLDMLYHELQTTGSISATGPWASHITATKNAIPKDNPAAVLQWNQNQNKK